MESEFQKFPPGRVVLQLTSDQDFGKSASDLLLKDYPIQGTSLEVKTLTPSNVTFKVAGVKDSSSNAIAGDIEGKYVDFKNGLIFTQVSWNPRAK
jgi:voltage-dependent anion channel protein 2